MRCSSWGRRLGLTVAVFLAVCVGWVSIAAATDYCQDIAGRYIIVGDGSYITLNGAYNDLAVANAWPASGSQSALPAGKIQWIGGMSSSVSNAHFLIYTVHDDVDTSDCSDVTMELELRYSNTESDYDCPTSYNTMTTVWHLNTCNAPGVCQGNSCRVWVGKLLGFHNLSYYRFWQAVVTVDAAETDATASQCWPLASQNDCTLSAFDYN